MRVRLFRGLLVTACPFKALLTPQVHPQARRCVKSAAFSVEFVHGFQGLPYVVKTTPADVHADAAGLAGATLRLKAVSFPSTKYPGSSPESD